MSDVVNTIHHATDSTFETPPRRRSVGFVVHDPRASDAGTASVTKGDANWHDGPGWYWFIDDYPDEGSSGAFETREEAIAHANMEGYHVTGIAVVSL